MRARALTAEFRVFVRQLVLLACATGLTLPITISLILVLRARGVCCPKHPHQAIEAAAKGTEVATPMPDAKPSSPPAKA